MKTKLGRVTIPLLVLLVLALSVVVVATSIAPSAAQARTRLENTSPLAGDPDTPEAPTSSNAKAAGISRSLTTIESGTQSAESDVRNARLSWQRVAQLIGAWLTIRRI
jgi:hypothetical protein